MESIKQKQLHLESELREGTSFYFCNVNIVLLLVTKRECQMKTDHQSLVDEIEKLNGQVGKGKQAIDTKQSEENELRSELVVRDIFKD